MTTELEQAMRESKSDYLACADCLSEMSLLPESFVDACVTDPPYGLNFMGKKWDYEVPSIEIWRAVLRVLKPGGYLLVFGGSRTYHRLAVNVEDAGFEIRDQIMWLYGSGFPKSSEACLKPAHEPLVLARKPLIGSLASNNEKYGTGYLSIEDCRVPFVDEADKASATPQGRCTSKSAAAIGATPDAGRGLDRIEFDRPVETGRFPANVIHDGSEEVTDAFPITKSGKAEIGSGREGNHTRGIYGAKASKITSCFADEGSASRFFYCAKAAKSERGKDNQHPTVKPLALMEYLVRLVTKPSNIVLDPFMGSGTTGIACNNTRRFFVGIEREPEYFALARKRMGLSE